MPIRRRPTLVLAAVLGSVLAHPAVSAQGYTFSTINAPGATNGTYAYGINTAGQIVGSYQDATGILHGYLDNGGTFSTVDVPRARGTNALGINPAGQIVGFYFDERGNHGFLDTGGTFSTLDVPGARSTEASGINAAGQIVGTYFDRTGNHGFLATPTAAVVPEPASVALVAAGLGVVGAVARRRTRLTA